MTNRAFARLAIIAIRGAGHPLESGEVVEELRKIGHPIGGSHEIKTAYNLLWRAKKDGVLTHFKGMGYWVVGSELTDAAREKMAAIRTARRRDRGKDRSRVRGKTGRPHGARDALNDGEKEAARKMLLSGKTSIREVAAYFHVSDATMRRYLRNEIKTLREQRDGRRLPRRVRRSSNPIERGTRSSP